MTTPKNNNPIELPDEIVFKLNENLKLHYKSRSNIKLFFLCENISRTFDVGYKEKAAMNYLDNSEFLKSKE